MIRRISILLFSFFLLFTFIGITVNLHYCGTNLIFVNLKGKSKSCCGNHCKSCHDKTFQVKVSDNYIKPITKAIHEVKIFFLSSVPTAILNWDIPSAKDFSTYKFFSDSDPPQIYKQSTSYLEVFRL